LDGQWAPYDEQLPDLFVNDLLKDRSGAFWIGTREAGKAP
jgi:hypothetical protein